MATPVLDRLDVIQDNLRVALGWWLDAAQPVAGLKLVDLLGDFWHWRGFYAEGRHWLEAMLGLVDSAARASDAPDDTERAVPLDLHSRALDQAGLLASRQGDYSRARTFHEASERIWRELGNSAELAHAQSWLALDLWCEGDLDCTTVLLDESLRLSRAAGAGDEVAQNLRIRGLIARSLGQYERAAELFRESAAESLAQGWYRGYPYAR